VSVLRPVLSLLVVVVALSAPAAATAQESSCTCAGPRSDAEAFEQAVYVFTARAVAPVELAIPDGSRPADGWSFVVTGVAKGRVGPEQLVAVPPESDGCSMHFERDREYLVFATDARSDLPAAVVAVDPCGGTRAASVPFDGELSFREARPIPIDTDAFPVVDDPLAVRREGDRLTLRAAVIFALIIGGTTGVAVWLWRTRTDTP